MHIRIQEAFNVYSHLAGVIAAVVGTVFLAIVASYSISALIIALIYGSSVIFLFLASSLYHTFKKGENELSFWRRMDRFAIFLHDCRHLYTDLLFIHGWYLALVHDCYPVGTCGIWTCLSTFFSSGT